jgi:hypothetical protein
MRFFRQFERRGCELPGEVNMSPSDPSLGLQTMPLRQAIEALKLHGALGVHRYYHQVASSTFAPKTK